MARQRKSSVVSGYNVYKAAQRVSPEETAPPASDTPVRDGEPAPPKAIGSHIGRTVMPSKHDITCYECGFEFQLVGSVKNAFCGKCRKNITVEQVVIDKTWEGDVKTAGTAIIRRKGVVAGGMLVANHIVLEGGVAGGRIQAFRWLELRNASAFDPDRMTSTGLRIAADVHMIRPTLTYHDIEVAGTLRSRVEATGAVHVVKGGRLEGEVHAHEIQVDAGGALNAVLFIEPSAGDVEDESEPPDPALEESA